RPGRSRRRPGVGDGPRRGPRGGECRGGRRRERGCGAGADRPGSPAARRGARVRGARRGAGRTPAARCVGAGARRRAQGSLGPGRHRRGGGLPRRCLSGGGAYGQAARPGPLDRAGRGREPRPRASRSTHGRGPAPRGARPRGTDGTAGDHRAARRARGAPLAGGGGARMTAPAAAYDKALDLITRVRGVRGAMLVSAEDGIVVAEQLMEGIKGPAVSALAASLATRLRRAMEAAGVGASLFWHLQAEHGALLVVPTDEMARQLSQPPFAALNHQGERHGIFLAGLATGRGRLVALVVYDLDVSSLGLVQLFFEQLAAELQAASPKDSVPKQVLAA